MAGLDLSARGVNADPDSFAREALAGDHVQWSDAQRGWLLLSHAEVAAGFLDQRLSSDRMPALARQVERRGERFQPVAELLAGWMVFRDPPAHTRLREPVWRAFTPRVVQRLKDGIDRTVDELVDEVRDEASFELKERFAGPLPALIIADLLGVPRSERERFKAWSDDLAEIVFSVDAGTVDEDRVVRATDEFHSFFGELIAHRRRQPGDDLISTVVASGAADESQPGHLTVLELVGACTLLLFAGHETTTNLITNSVRTLVDQPDARARFARQEIDDVKAADELMRLCGPAKSMVRKVRETHRRGEHTLEAGQNVYLVILVANRDPGTFVDPDRMDLDREFNPQLGFGWGMHLCLGGNLARVEASVALKGLFRRMPELAFDGEPTRWSGNPLGRNLRALPVRA
ncbi:MAG: cytochrome P450 [Acidimicrobiia bacterium]|nr:cytochrome P450 [Acidimicrobiia bacterium]